MGEQGSLVSNEMTAVLYFGFAAACKRCERFESAWYPTIV